MEHAKEMEKTKKLIEFWAFLRTNAKDNATIDKCNKHLDELYNKKFELWAWFLQ